MKIGLFDPYLDTLGGGERYILSIAECLQDKHDVQLFWNDKDILKKAKEKFLLNLSKVSLKPNIFTKDTTTLARLKKTYGFDYFFYMSDGSIPLVASRHVIPILQFPIDGLNAKNFTSRVKLVNTLMVLCYSEFVKKFLEKQYSVPIRVLYPAVPKIQGGVKKENIILSVGRFTRGNNTKNQEMLIKFFNAHKIHFKNWKLILAGSYLEGDEDFVSDLRRLIGKSAIELYTNINFAALSRLYARSKIYWHAAGYGGDIEKNPKSAEHFGITVVEAMSIGSVPVVFNGGGLKEIVQDGLNGFVWSSEKELFDKTKMLMTDTWKLDEMASNAQKRSEDFSIRKFCESINEIIN